MLENRLKTLLTGVVLACLILSFMPVALSDSTGSTDDYGGYAREKIGKERTGMGQTPKTVYMTVSLTGGTNSSATYTIDNVAMGGKENKTAVFSFNNPLPGTYNMTSDMAYISTANALPMTATFDTIDNATIPVAGANMVIGLKDLNVIAKEKGYHVSETSKMAVFLPDGTVKAYALDQPIRITHSEDRQMVVVDAYPSFTKRMSDDLGNATTTFAPGTAPVNVSGLSAKWTSATPAIVGYEMPRNIAPPA